MTASQALQLALMRGTVDPDSVLPLATHDWWNEDCDDIWTAVVAVRDCGLPRTDLNVARALYVTGYTRDQAVELAIRANWTGAPYESAIDAANWLRAQGAA